MLAERVFETATHAHKNAKRAEAKRLQDEKVAELADIIRTYRGVGAEEDDMQDLRWFEGPMFDITMCAIILLNMFVIGLEVDLGDPDKSGYDRSALWISLEWLFCLIFMGEIAIKVRHVKWEGVLAEPWNWLAIFVAALAFVELVILSPLKVSGLRMFSMVRIVNLLRLKKVIEHHKMLKELKLVIRGVVGSGVSLVWSMVVLMLIMFVFSIWTTTLIGYREGYSDLKGLTNGWNNEALFGSIGRSMFTLVQVMTLDTWCSGIARHVAIQQWYMIFLFVVFGLLTTYGIVNLIISIIVEQTLEATHNNNSRVKAREEKARKAEMDAIRDIFLLSDVDASQDLTSEEFTEACAMDSEVQWRLRQLELPMEDVMRLFQVIDGDGSRSLTMKEFVEGCTKLKGVARSKDLLALQHQADNMSKKMDSLGKELRDSELLLARLDDTSRRMSARMGTAVMSSRRGIEARVRGAAPLKPLPPEKAGSVKFGHLQAGNMPKLPDLPNLVN
jgi:voltage-gated sodium channel